GVRSFETTLLSRKMNDNGERPPLSAATSNGNSRTCRSLTLSWLAGFSVCNTGVASPDTVTVLTISPTSSVTSTVRITWTATLTFSTEAVLKPVASTLIVKTTAGNCGI